MKNGYDIAIVGGGLAGASLACCLAGLPLRVAVFEQFAAGPAQPSYDERGLALSLSSYRILNAINLWPALAGRAVPVKHIHVSDKGKFGFVRLHAADLGLPAMGYVVTASDLGHALLEKIGTLENVDYICPAVVGAVDVADDRVKIDLVGSGLSGTTKCRLLVAADGSNSLIRQMLGIQVDIKDYQQTAVVANVTTVSDHGNTAYERFTRDGPLALLPMSQGRSVSIFTVPEATKDDYLRLKDDSYLAVIQNIFGARLGRFNKVGSRKAYPLRLVQATRQYQDRIVLLGNAAHTVHPNGAQGFNLGLRDVAALAELIIKAVQQQDPGNESLLSEYARSRAADQSRVVRFTDTIANLFYNDDPVKTLWRTTGMLALDSLPLLKQRFMQQAMGIHGRQPGLVRGLNLDQL